VWTLLPDHTKHCTILTPRPRGGAGHLIEKLRRDIDAQRDMIRRMEDEIEDGNRLIEQWCETFEMQMTDDGAWTWQPWWDEHNELVDNYNDLVRRWNRHLPLINGRTQPVGRPLLASEAQVAEVLKLHKRGRSLAASPRISPSASIRSVLSSPRATPPTAPPSGIVIGKWKKAHGLSADEKGRKAKALMMVPEAAELLSRKRDHHRSEAMLLAHFGAKLSNSAYDSGGRSARARAGG